MIGRAVVALLALVALAACGETGDGAAAEPHPSGVASCVQVGPVPSGAAAADALAALALPCLDGGEARLGRLGRPAVVNLWASWCEPCYRELPAVQRFADRAGGSVLVVGVATRTGRGEASAAVADLGLTFPTLYDRDGKLLLAVEKVNLPVTLFIDPYGRLAHTHATTVLDDAVLTALVAEHLGVEVPA